MQTNPAVEQNKNIKWSESPLNQSSRVFQTRGPAMLNDRSRHQLQFASNWVYSTLLQLCSWIDQYRKLNETDEEPVKSCWFTAASRGRIHRLLRKGISAERGSSGATVYLDAVMEYLAANRQRESFLFLHSVLSGKANLHFPDVQRQ